MSKRGLAFSLIMHLTIIVLLLQIVLEKDLPKNDEVMIDFVYKAYKSPKIENKTTSQKTSQKLSQKPATNKKDVTEETQFTITDSIPHLTNLRIYNRFTQPNTINYKFNKYWIKKLSDKELWLNIVKRNPSNAKLYEDLQKQSDNKNIWKYRIEKEKEPQMNFRLQFAPYSDGFQNGKINERMNSGGISLPISETIKSIIDLF